MLNFKKKYLKYKEKYLNLKKMIGGGIDATYTIDAINNKIILTYSTIDGVAHEIKYTIIREIGRGSFGIVHLIKNDNNEKQYIFKEAIDPSLNALYKEGIQSDLLKGILDDDMLVLFQGKSASDFLISTYNGNNLYEEFKDKPHEIKEKYATITIQLLDLLHTINKDNIFHNDIKCENITIKDNKYDKYNKYDKVYLIDFGLLTKFKSKGASLISMSYNGVIAFLTERNYYDYNDYNETFHELKAFLKDTDIVGFFYCCIDLLLLTGDNYSNSIRLLKSLGIKGFDDIYKLFELFYFILPESKRYIPRLNEMVSNYDKLLPSEKKAKDIFGIFPDEHINLFRFMAYIYDNIKNNIIKNEKQQIWYQDFLKIMSACFLPTFNYEEFKPQFNAIVLQFSALPDGPDPTPPPVSDPTPPPVSDPTPPPVSDPTSAPHSTSTEKIESVFVDFIRDKNGNITDRTKVIITWNIPSKFNIGDVKSFEIKVYKKQKKYYMDMEFEKWKYDLVESLNIKVDTSNPYNYYLPDENKYFAVFSNNSTEYGTFVFTVKIIPNKKYYIDSDPSDPRDIAPIDDDDFYT